MLNLAAKPAHCRHARDRAASSPPSLAALLQRMGATFTSLQTRCSRVKHGSIWPKILQPKPGEIPR